MTDAVKYNAKYDPKDPTKLLPEYAYRRAQPEIPGITQPVEPGGIEPRDMTAGMWRGLRLFYDRGGVIPVRARPSEPLTVRADVLARLQHAGLIQPAYIEDRPAAWGITEAGRKLLAARGYKRT